MTETCPWCQGEYKNLSAHLRYCKLKPVEDFTEEVIEEPTIEEETLLNLQENDLPLELPSMNLTTAEENWIHQWIIGFKFNGQVTSKDAPFLISVYKKNVKEQIDGCLTCPNVLIYLGTCVYAKYKQIYEN